MRDLYIIDLRYNDYNIKITDSKIIYLNSGHVDDKNSKILKLEKITNSTYIKNKFLNELKKKIETKKNYFLKEFEIFNVRNDKNLEISKVLNYLKIKDFLKKNKFRLHCISDNKNSIEILKDLSKNSIQVKFREKIKYSNDIFKSPSLYFIKYILKIFTFLILSKIFSQKYYLSLFKNKKKWSLSLYPNFYKRNKETFFGSNYNKLNFLFTDETHLNFSLLKALKIFFFSRKKFVNIESFIKFKDIFFSLKYFISYRYQLDNKINESFYIDGINFTDFYQSSIKISFLNRSKLLIYNKSLKRFIDYYKLKEFHIYLFEYNFGFYLLRRFNEKKIKMIGYQHGIFDKNLMWLDVLNLKEDRIFSPEKIISNYLPSLKLYKTKYNEKIKFIYKRKKISNLLNKISIKNKKDSKYEILFLSGTHDIKDIYYYANNLTKQNNDIFIYIKLHPKNKFNFKDSHQIKKIEILKNKKFDKVLISSTSTITYDFSLLRKKYEIFKADYKSC